jgi:uncharacterized protein YggU (UPF0235/DUF167 family)
MPVARMGVRVAASSMRTEIVGRHAGGWKVRVAVPPERGRANDAVLDLLAAALRIPRVRVRLVKGAAARDKVVEIEGMTPAEADRRLAGGQRKGDQ